MGIKTKIGSAALSVALLSTAAAYAGGLWQTLPVVGGAAYCASTVSGTGALSGTTGQGQGTTGSICAQTVPAGPAVFSGKEVAPFDLNTPGAQVTAGGAATALINIQQLGQGTFLDNTTVATATIPAGTVFYSLDGTQASAFTITMPVAVVDGQFQEIICTAATAGVLTVAANTSVVTQVIKNNPNAACVAGTVYKWRYNAANLTWFRV